MLRVELELNSYYRKCNGNLVYILYCLTTGGGGGGEGGRDGCSNRGVSVVIVLDRVSSQLILSFCDYFE